MHNMRKKCFDSCTMFLLLRDKVFGVLGHKAGKTQMLKKSGHIFITSAQSVCLWLVVEI